MTQKCEMKLLGATGSTFATRVRLALELKSIEYEHIEEDLLNKSEFLHRSNPAFARVPVLFHADKEPITESLVIMEYLDEIRPEVHPLLPSDPFERAQCRMLAYTFDNMCYPWMKEVGLTKDNKKREKSKKMVIEGIAMIEEAFVKMSKGKAFFGGDDIGYVDIAVGTFLGWVKLIEREFDFKVVEEARNPRLAQWAKSMWSHEVAQRLLPTDEIQNEFFKMVITLNPPSLVPP